jgi:hypothetical protein
MAIRLEGFSVLPQYAQIMRYRVQKRANGNAEVRTGEKKDSRRKNDDREKVDRSVNKRTRYILPALLVRFFHTAPTLYPIHGTGPNDVTELSSDSARQPSGEGVTAIRGWSYL